MNEERQKILNIFDDKVKLKNPSNREKQERIEQLIKEIYSKGTEENDNNTNN